MKTKLVIFGITGDLSRRKLLPALHQIVLSGEVPELSIIGVSRREVDIPSLIKQSTADDVLTPLTTVYSMDLANVKHYDDLKTYLNLQADEQALIYLSVPPNAATDIVDMLGKAGLNTANVKLLFEKPFGFDLESAQDFVARTARYFEETQLYRIDHYMAKEVASEVIRLRTKAETHHEWSKESVERVDIVATETLDIENRTVFYEQTGALRDFIQGHLMQLLALVLIDLSAPFQLDQLAERRLTALELLNYTQPQETIRAQYEGYAEQVNNPGSQTETFASVTMTSRDDRWRGVPLRLVTGKALDRKRSAIIISYRDGDEDVIEEGMIPAKDQRLPDAYERVLVEAIRNRKYIFTTSPEILRSWELLKPVQEAWEMNLLPLKTYPKGSSLQDIIEVEKHH